MVADTHTHRGIFHIVLVDMESLWSNFVIWKLTILNIENFDFSIAIVNILSQQQWFKIIDHGPIMVKTFWPWHLDGG